ncbi:MAG: lipase, partial [Clostridia bacterium]|nr:lipase [Clostridia bacterium]
NITLRYLATCAFGGNKLRLHFSNFCGTEPVTFEKVTVALAAADREINLNGLKEVTFSGKTSVTVGAGKEIFSDEIDFSIKAKETVAVSIYLKDCTLMRSGVVVTGPLSKGFFSVGDATRASVLPLDYTRTLSTYYFLTGIDLFTEDRCRCIICYGDSITSQSWPDYLAMKFMQDEGNAVAVIRRAASGTRVLREYKCITYESYGLCGKRRFEREISSVSGADTVIIQQGINDIIHPVGEEVNPFRPMSDLPTVDELEEGIKYYVSLAKKRKLKVFLGTLLPIYGWRTYAPFREEMKDEFNARLRSNAYADGCIDFESCLKSDENPFAFKEGFDSGDHLHPSEKAYAVMAETAYRGINK